jgi:hypothetical protein
MITRRNIFGFFGLPLLPSRWRLFARKPARQMMMKSENGVRSYFAEDRSRFESLSKNRVIIERHDLKKMFVLNLATKTYSIKPFQPTAKVRLRVTKGNLKRVYPDFRPFEPALFEVPADFTKASF